ncbi:MAG TPA: molecular chaperone HscC [Tahibacter sp.]|nr:molecular chaperone HscC [Tahibacter sp.]
MIVGIDLGTTHSLIGVWTADGATLVPNALGELLTPSAVGVDADDKIIVGRGALERLATQPDRHVATFKRYMGSARETRLGNRAFRPEELSALVLRSLVADVEAHTGDKVTEAVISVPAYFSDAQRKATRNAGQIAGIHVERLVNEPTAAALAYGLQAENAESKFLVFDLGGGTFDVSILETFEGVMEVHASAGDNFLGGEDFVDLLYKTALQDLGVAASLIAPDEESALRARVERVKCQLTNQAALAVPLTIAGKEYEWNITETRFETLAAPLLARMRAPVERALRDSRTRPDGLLQIVLVGGASRMPMIGRMVARMFGRLPLRHINPDQTVALGTCVMAGMKARHEAFDEVVMTDVCPYTLGVETSRVDENQRQHDGLFSPLIERNTVIPASRVSRYNPLRDFQPVLKLRVFQGESPRVANNVFLGELEVPLPRRTSSENAVDVRFTYDVNGLLDVEAMVVATGATHQLVIERNPGLLTPEEIRARLAALAELKVHPREHQANIAVLARAERLYEENTGQLRQALTEHIHAFSAELATQDLQNIARARQRFAEFLDRVESQSVF